MKLMMTIILFSLSQMTMASYVSELKKLNWEELRANWDVDFEGDQIWFDGKILSVLDTCMSSPTIIRSLDKVLIEEYDGDEFTPIGYEYLYKSIYSTRTMVDGDDTIDIPYTVKTKRNIKVVNWDEEFEGEFLFYKEFEIPSC